MAVIVWQQQGLRWDEVCRRASARRKWNERRQAQARHRRQQVLDLWLEGEVTWGWQSHVAEALGVHRSTITRDLQQLRGNWGLRGG